MGKKSVKIISLILAVVIFVIAVVPLFFGGYKKVWNNMTKKNYTTVLVHGLGGWGTGAKINNFAKYWGADSGSITEYLNSEGYNVCEANIGPFSSAWDRACELYAQITGTRTDYGEAHSKKHNHERFGRTYETPLVAEWNEKNKINLIGHSFGGNTVRLFASILENGCREEVEASGKNVSEFFKGGNYNVINGIVTLNSPHNGSTLYSAMDKPQLIKLGLKIIFAVSGLKKVTDDFVDLQLDQFGMKKISVDELVNNGFFNKEDNAFYDLSPEGSKALNDVIIQSDDIKYFSYSYRTTKTSELTGHEVPTAETRLILKAPALIIGKYLRDDGEIKIDETWLANDGLVNVKSAKYPFDEKYEYYTEDIKIERGKWYVMPLRTGDHGTSIGMTQTPESMHIFYTEIMNLIN